MARPPEKLAQSLEVLRNLQTAEGAGAIRARDLTRTHRERLLKNGFLQEVIKGWYIPSRPDEVKGESTAWYASNVRRWLRRTRKRPVYGTASPHLARARTLALRIPDQNSVAEDARAGDRS